MKKLEKKSQKGFTLIELLVAIGVFSTVIAIAVGGFTRALRAQREDESLLSAESNTSLAIEEMAREIRTGYAFCHDPGINNGPAAVCGCTVSASSFAEAGAPGALPGGNLPIWTCTDLNYFSAESQNVEYKLVNGALERGVGGNFQSVTGDTVTVKSLKFILFGNTEGDNWTPRVTVAIGIAASSTDPAVANSVLNIQTTVSARGIDCTPTSPAQC